MYSQFTHCTTCTHSTSHCNARACNLIPQLQCMLSHLNLLRRQDMYSLWLLCFVFFSVWHFMLGFFKLTKYFQSQAIRLHSAGMKCHGKLNIQTSTTIYQAIITERGLQILDVMNQELGLCKPIEIGFPSSSSSSSLNCYNHVYVLSSYMQIAKPVFVSIKQLKTHSQSISWSRRKKNTSHPSSQFHIPFSQSQHS